MHAMHDLRRVIDCIVMNSSEVRDARPTRQTNGLLSVVDNVHGDVVRRR